MIMYIAKEFRQAKGPEEPNMPSETIPGQAPTLKFILKQLQRGDKSSVRSGYFDGENGDEDRLFNQPEVVMSDLRHMTSTEIEMILEDIKLQDTDRGTSKSIETSQGELEVSEPLQ